MNDEKIETIKQRAIKQGKKDLAESCKNLLDFHERYSSGEGDVIFGLQYMDAREEEILERAKVELTQ